MYLPLQSQTSVVIQPSWGINRNENEVPGTGEAALGVSPAAPRKPTEAEGSAGGATDVAAAAGEILQREINPGSAMPMDKKSRQGSEEGLPRDVDAMLKSC
ncbi:unnamed protein product [Eretmochelys imbricata]